MAILTNIIYFHLLHKCTLRVLSFELSSLLLGLHTGRQTSVCRFSPMLHYHRRMPSAFSLASSVGVEVRAGHGVDAGLFYVVFCDAGLDGQEGVGEGEVEEVFSVGSGFNEAGHFFFGEEGDKGFHYF